MTTLKCCKLLKPSFKKYGIAILILVLGFATLNIYFLTEYFTSYTINLDFASKLGDYVGGYLGAFITLVSVTLFYLTLQEQRESSERLSFETKYFELIRMHRENVAELEIENESGRKIFEALIREFHELFAIVKKYAEDSFKLQLHSEQLIHITYYCFCFGARSDSSRILERALKQSLPKTFNQAFIEALVRFVGDSSTKEMVKIKGQLKYTPFEGHLSRLGHYYRHLYQTVKYVNQQALDIKDKKDFVKTVRAQLTTDEQALLLLNSLSPIGDSWWEDNFIIDYEMVRNIPRDFFDPKTEFDILSLKKFPNGYFEFEDYEENVL